MSGSTVARVSALGAAAVAACAVAVMGLAFAWNEPTLPFLVTALVAAGAAAPVLAVRRPPRDPSRREALGTVVAVWALVPLLAAVPFVAAGTLTPIDAWFESVSGWTTTGATVLPTFDGVARSIFLWRALTQWLGGIGILVLFVAVFPFLAVAGRQLFQAEAPGPEHERLAPRIASTARALALLYASLTGLCALAYLASGMGPFDAVAHALTTLASGGFSPEARSFEAFGASSQWVAIAFMTLAGANFALQYRALSGRPRSLTSDPEFRTYLGIVALVAVALTLLIRGSYDGAEALRHGLFQSLTIVTSTGYASVDFALWSEAAQGWLLAAMFVGGCAGSAAGGVKVVRWRIAVAHARSELVRALHPRAVVPVRLGRRIVPDSVTHVVTAFLILFAVSFAATALALLADGVDLRTAVSAAIACLANIGPGLGAVGPMESFAAFSPWAKGALILAMTAGRLEVLALFAWLAPVRRRGMPVAAAGPATDTTRGGR